MRKIWLIFKEDLKNIFNNGATFILIAVVLIVPSLFAAFIIKANWTPINNSKEVKIAIVNKDKGGMIYNKLVNIGNMVAREVEKDIYLNWEILPYDEAFRGYLLGDIYGVIVIPEEFTQGIATVVTDTPVLPKIAYMINERESVFTPTVTGTSGIRLQIHVARNITYAINNAVRNALKEYNIDFTIDNEVIKETVNALLDLDANKEDYVKKLKEYRDLAGSMMVLLTNLKDELPDLGQNITRVENITSKAQRFFDVVDELETEYENASGSKAEVQVQKNEVLVKELGELAAYIREEIPKIEEMVTGADNIVTQVYATLNKVDSTLTNITKDLHGLERKLGFLANDEGIDKLIYMLENEPGLVKEAIVSPVLMEKRELDGLPNYGSSLAPFNITVAMWMGTNVLITMFSTKVQSDEPELKEVTGVQEYLGKSLFFIMLGSIQDLGIIISCKQVLGIYIENYGMFLMLGMIGSITFSVLIYTLVSVLGNVGRIMAYMLSVLQLFFLGGVYPTQIVPLVFRNINKMLPFIYVIGSFRETQMGIITDNLLKSAATLFIFMICAILFGLLGKTVFAPCIANARRLIRDSHLGKQDY